MKNKKVVILITLAVLIIITIIYKITSADIEEFVDINSSYSKDSYSMSDGSTVYMNTDGELIINKNGSIEKVPISPFSSNNAYIVTFCYYKNNIYYLISYEDKAYVYKYNYENRITEKIYEENIDDFLCNVTAMTTNGSDVILIYNDRVKLINISTQISRTILNYSTDVNMNIAVHGTNIYYGQELDVLKCYSLVTGETNEIADVMSDGFVLYDNKVFFIDCNNEGRLSSYDLGDNVVKNYDTEYVMYFSYQIDGVYVQYDDKSVLLDEYE